jgi:peptidoglycan L-alanyl-D-glutamate endopeptidase CwlK
MINSRKVEDLKPDAQNACLKFIRLCTEAGLNIKIIQTLRDAEYQHHLYEQGRTAPGKIVTKCDGYKHKSRHQSGEAWDAVVLDDEGDIDWDNISQYKKMADIGVKMGLTAGFYFFFRDLDHFEVKGKV